MTEGEQAARQILLSTRRINPAKRERADQKRDLVNTLQVIALRKKNREDNGPTGSSSRGFWL
jgi:hypothetical protein